MNQSSGFAAAFEHARSLHMAGRLQEAEQAYRRLTPAPGREREAVLRKLAELYSEARNPEATIATLVALTEAAPEHLPYYVQLASMLELAGRSDVAIGHYRRLLTRRPEMAAAHFNIALLYKKNKRYKEAIAAYEEAARLGISGVQEVWSNLGVLYSEMHQPERAAEMFERALAVDPEYLPAMFNRAGLHEEVGQKEEAIELYRRIRTLDPEHWGALARIACASRVESADDGIVETLKSAIEETKDDRLAREELLFALGKSLDDLGRYDEAFAAYRSANELGKLRVPPYDRPGAEKTFDRLMNVFDAAWIERSSTGSTETPIFICGMFRSGSTLLEQLLAAHPAVTAGGELDFLPWLVARRLSPYPDGAATASREVLQQLGSDYLAKSRELFPDAEHITDKRPDNFLYLGLVKALFPHARIVHTRRQPLDVCLSVYFQQLAAPLSYATDPENTAHYYLQHERLMQHWYSCFPENLFTVDYDELVQSPEPVLRRLLDFLGLAWDDRCLAFRQSGNLVKTASVWQVREELHGRSSGRWRNYEAHLQPLLARRVLR
jgi:tetratricopeptide (TPR) repeat protein